MAKADTAVPAAFEIDSLVQVASGDWGNSVGYVKAIDADQVTVLINASDLIIFNASELTPVISI